MLVPVNTTPPTITGTIQFGQTLKCNPGDWSGDPVSFSYAWGSESQVKGTKRTFYVEDPYFSAYPLGCTVTATDAAGETATARAPGSVAAAGVPKIKITDVRVLPKGRFTVTGKVGPKIVAKSYGTQDSVVIDRPLKRADHANLQVSQIATVKANGKFTVTGTDDPGRRHYKVVYHSDNPQVWTQGEKAFSAKITSGRVGDAFS
jgi:hypothetical protein